MTMKEHDSKRRTVLIGTLAAGAALMLQGCKGREGNQVRIEGSGDSARVVPK